MKNAPPATLRDLLIKVRTGLRLTGDDGSAGARRKVVGVCMGWREVRAIYNLCTSVGTLRDKCSALKKRLAAAEKSLERHRKDITDHNLISDRAVLDLITELSLLAWGADLHPDHIRALQERSDRVLARSKKVDRRRAR